MDVRNLLVTMFFMCIIFSYENPLTVLIIKCDKGYRQPPTVLGEVLSIGVMPVIMENTL